ncbi:MAG: hypothetical protein QN178_12710 [Armatimonadota bacterium]|nr:hypothetical protein [Armatimonadota bacterium]
MQDSETGAPSSVMCGIIFLGAPAYFIHGYFRPMWANAAGPR